MGLEHLLLALERDAGAQVERLLAEARAEAERISAAAQDTRAQHRRETLGERERVQRQDLERALTAARRAARHTALESRHRLLDRVFAAAYALLPEAICSPAFRATLPDTLAAALASVGLEPVVIRCAAPLADELRGLAPSARASVVVDATVGSGFRVTTADGAIEVDCTLEARIERQRPALARLALRHLGVES